MSTVYTRWRARLAARRALLTAARKRHVRRPTAQTRALLEKRKAQVAYAERVVARHKPKPKAPKIVDLGKTVENRFGVLGPVIGVVGHYTAGPRDRDDAHALALWRQYHAQHAAQGWGGIGYHFGITRKGTIVLLRPVRLKGAHTAGANTGRVGVVCHGTTGDRPTAAQAKAYRWLLANAHTSAMPASHRVDLRRATRTVHRDHYPTACPGGFERMYRSGGTDR